MLQNKDKKQEQTFHSTCVQIQIYLENQLKNQWKEEVINIINMKIYQKSNIKINNFMKTKSILFVNKTGFQKEIMKWIHVLHVKELQSLLNLKILNLNQMKIQKTWEVLKILTSVFLFLKQLIIKILQKVKIKFKYKYKVFMSNLNYNL